ncbi:phage tail protein [Paucibacter sp. M5-1]|uniref:phage tail protein n=1 Tax=Paucibacter sp. M5-1 TaxID=3015998 RepID=UPI003F7F9C4D
MDINGLRSFGLGFEPHGLKPWAVPQNDGSSAVTIEPAPQHRLGGLRLAGRASPLALQEDAADVDAVLLQPSLVIDAVGNHLCWDGAALVSNSHLAAAHGLAPQALALPPEALPVTDMTLGADDVLYLLANGALWLLDLRGRFALTRLAAPEGLQPQRLASAAEGGVWVLDVAQGRLAHLRGLPLFTRPVHLERRQDARLAACDPNPDPPRWRLLPDAVPADEKALALASHREGGLLLLSLRRAGGGVRLRRLLDDGRLSLPLSLAGPRFAHTLAWFDGEQIALATRGQLLGADGRPRDPGVWLYALPAALRQRWQQASQAGRLSSELQRPLQPQGGYYPLAGWTGGPFVAARPGSRLHYPGRDGPVPVARVAGITRARYGLAANSEQAQLPGVRARAAAGLIDSGDPACVWHRLYLEAAVPHGCALLVWLAVGEQGAPAFTAGRAGQGPRWAPHLVGERTALPAALAAALPDDLPRAAWVAAPTEQPLGQGLLCCAAEPGRTGLFTVLIQRAGTAVRALQGARLWVAVELFGDGRATPELAALRAYAGRLSYRDRYLPALYHEQLFGSDAEQRGRASPADFLERFLLLFEGLFSDIEARIAASALLTDAMACPPEALPWLAGWLGLSLEPGLPTERARWMLANAPALARQHGTLAGLQRALDIATEGALTRGRIVVVEDFRLRRSLATILGARLEDRLDPLTSGLTQSGNSVLGDTLFLGDARVLADEGFTKTFLALFRDLGSETAAEQAESAAARRALFDALAYRVTVLVHEELASDELGLVRRLAEQGAPAHVQLRVVPAAHPFMVGVAALVGADSYLRSAPPSRPVRAGPGAESSALGGVDRLRGEASLDAHAGAFDSLLPPAASAEPPVARIHPADFSSDPITALHLDGSASSAADGHSIASYDWLHRPPL